MNNETAVQKNQNGQYNLTEAHINTLVQAGIIPQGTPPAQISLFSEVCKQKGLSPFSKEVYLLGYKDRQSGQMKYSIITGIDGYRKIAARTGQFAGCGNPVFNLKANGTFQTAAELVADNKMPDSCTVTAIRLIAGQKCEFTATVLFREFSTGQQKWATMPFHMIAKVAESFAIRKAFDDELAGIGTEEEAGAYEGNTISATAKVKELPELTPEHDKWNDAIKALKDERVTIEQIRKKYTLSEENKLILLDHALEAV